MTTFRIPWPAVMALLAATAPASADAQELTLTEAVASALESHPSLDVASAMTTRAEEETATARAQRLPNLAMGADLTRFQEPMVVAPLHAFDPLRPPSFDRSLVQGRLTARYTVVDWGERSARIRAGEASAESAELAAEDALAELLQQVVGAYLGVLTTRAVRTAADAHVSDLEAELDRVERNRQAGTAAEVEVLRASATLAGARADAASAAERAGLAERSLARVSDLPLARISGEDLAGVSVRDLERTDLPALAVGAPPARTNAASRTSPTEGIEGRSREVERARRGVSVAEARLVEQRSARLPRIEASAGLLDFGTLGGNHAAEWQAGVQLSWPVFTGGAQSARVRAARAGVDAARAELATTELIAEEQVDIALTAVAEADARAAALEAAVQQWAEVARIERLALDTGSGVQRDLLRAQAGLFEARAGLARARHDGVLARVGLAAARGTLDRDWIDRTLEVER
jgi:outer membrane protein